MNNRLINTKVAGGGGGCTDIVDNYDPFDGGGVALYQLNGNATDVSGNYDGTATNVTYGTGVFGQAGVFNGSSSYVGMAENSWNSFTSYTLSAWIYDTGTATGGRTIASNYGYTAASNVEKGWIVMRVGTKLRVSNSTTGLASTYLSTNDIPFNQWANIVVTNTQSEIKIYFNGALDSTHSTIGFLNDPSWPMRPAIGVYRYDTTEQRNGYFSGQIDQVRIFNTVLDPLEVEALYTEELCICDGTVDTLDILGDGSCIATYQLDGNANDLSGNYSGQPTDVSYGVGEFDLAGVFNGSSSEITNSGTVNVDLDFSVSLWFNNQGAGTHNGQVLWNGKNRDNALQLNYSENTVSFFFYDGALKGVVTPAISSGWNNVVVTRSKTSGLEIYLNGISQATNSFTGNANTLTASETIGNLGRAGINRYFNGSIDQVRIFNKALNSTEVTTLYNESACTKAACSGTTNTLNILGDGSCIAAYPLDGSPADLSGNYNGVQTDVTYPVGEFDLAAAFNGNTSRIVLPNNAPISNQINCSVSLWFKVLNNTKTEILARFAYNDEVLYRINASGTLTLFGTRQSNSTYIVYDTTGTYNNGVWHHLVMTRESGSIKFYINNSLDNTLSWNNTFATSSIGNFIATAGDSNTSTLTGQIDQVRLFNKALSAGEVTTLYNETPCN